MKILLLTVLVLSVAINADKKTFDGYKVYKVIPKTEDEVKILENINLAGIGEAWNVNFKAYDDVRMMVKPEMQLVFEGTMLRGNIQVKTVIEDVQKAIDQQLKPNIVERSSRFHGMDWDNYHNLETIERWMSEVANAYSHVTTVKMGTSVEGRDINGIIINYDPNRQKPVAMLEGTLHAREWITPATVTWVVKELLTSTDPDVRFMAENLEWHVFPVVNPDGYVYTWNTNRMWRKNRSKANSTSCAWLEVDDDMSNGVDLNRNFDFFWNTAGSSSEPCLNTFAGPSAASEPETQAIATYATSLMPKKIVYYLSFHSYTQLFMVPYSHVSVHTEFPADNHDHLMEIASSSVSALQNRFGTNYRFGIAADVLYLMSGSSFDWVKQYANASVSFLIELRDMGEYGFLLPPDQIIPNNLEIMDALIEMDKSTRRLGYYSSSSSAVMSMTLLFSVLAFNLFK